MNAGGSAAGDGYWNSIGTTALFGLETCWVTGSA